MWIVKNMLKATVLLQDLQVKIAAGDYFDLDTVGRDRANESISLSLAFEEGYLQNIKKEGAEAEVSLTPGAAAMQATMANDSISHQLAELRQLIAAQQQQAAMQQAMMATRMSQAPMEPAHTGNSGGGSLAAEMKQAMSTMAQELAGSLRDQMAELSQQRQAVVAERREIMSSGKMDDAEMRARLAMLANKEAELKTNLDEIDRTIGHKTEGGGDAAAIADLLGDI